MEVLMLICEIIIGLVGIFTVIAGRDTHDRMHGIFVILLCFCGLCDHFFSHFAIISEIMLSVTAVYAVIFIAFFSVKEIRERAGALRENILEKKNRKK